MCKPKARKFQEEEEGCSKASSSTRSTEEDTELNTAEALKNKKGHAIKEFQFTLKTEGMFLSREMTLLYLSI